MVDGVLSRRNAAVKRISDEALPKLVEPFQYILTMLVDI